MTYWNGAGWEADRPADPPRRRRGRRFLGAAAEAGLITLLIFGLIAGTALAAKGTGGKPAGRTQSTLTLVVLAPPDANHGEQVTFEVSTSATDQPMVEVNCLQAGVLVYWASAGFYDAYPWPWARNFTLQSTYWTEGSADCVATLYMYDGRRYRDLAELTFAVGS